MIYTGIVNITGCFVDIGVKESGLVHISQLKLKAGFWRAINEVVKLNVRSGKSDRK
jgi:uncharacterized protein